MKVAVSKPNKSLENYLSWLDFFNIEYDVLDWQKSDNINNIDLCNGLILTGGVDIYPEIYCDWESNKDEVKYIPERDGFELRLLEQAISINVYFKGNLISDLELIRGVNHKKITETEPRYHKIKIYENTLLEEFIRSDEGIVTSTHHQAIDRVGESLKINAKSEDGIIEGIEYEDKINKHFLLGIQWHPEKFSDFNNPFSKNILIKFYEETLKI